MKYCPAPNCSVVVEEPNEVGKQLVCICSCGYRFCYTCNDEAHVPATCEHLKHWKTKQDTESYSWIATNTKGMLFSSSSSPPGPLCNVLALQSSIACPGCGVSTEKHDGCFQMTCRMCKHQWCWLCSDDWITHKDHFACSKYKETKLTNAPEWKGDSKKDAQRKALDRYLHYYNRYMEHLNSLKLEDVTRKKARDMVKELPLEEAYLAPAVEEAITRLVECRRTLGWTYVR
jgi:ariadne-1